MQDPQREKAFELYAELVFVMTYYAGQAPAPALVADAKPPCCINVPFVAPLYLQTAQLV